MNAGFLRVSKGKKKSKYVKVCPMFILGHPATFSSKITVRRSKYCLEISKA